METTEPFAPSDAEPGINLTFEAQTYLREAGKWATFLGIIGFIGCGLILISAFSISGMLARVADVVPNQSFAILAGMGGVMTVMFILIDLIYFFFALYLYQFGDRIKKGLNFADTAHVTAGLGKLKSYFKLWGILTIVVLSFYALAIVGGIIFAVALSHRG